MANLIEMIDELQHYKRSKSELIETYINDRLQSSMMTYYKELSQSLEFLKKKDEARMMRKLNREV